MAKRVIMGAAAGLTVAGVAISTSSNPTAGEIKASAGTFFYKNVAWPVISQMGAETSHSLAVMSARYGLTPWDRVPDDPILKTSVLGLEMRNPLGLAAGCDKNGAAINVLVQCADWIEQIW
ncbi:hypothetical protein T484DRAFT_1777615 [Baffinella frigidus]|nr:hypothetical protein T484DRAFT_1777615 [Cryptophyta sp. CCMP2293]